MSVSPSNSSFDPSVGWIPIPEDVLKDCRQDFIDRTEALKAEYPEFDFSADLDVIEIDVTFFNDLVQNAELGHYLVAQYTCTTDLSKMGIALCIKEKGTGPDGDDKIIGHTYGPAGNQLSYFHEFIPSLYNYLRRKVQIFHAVPSSEASQAYDPDREGRAHQITETMKQSVSDMTTSGRNLYAYFILEDFNTPGVNQISVAFTDYLLDTSVGLRASPMDDGSAYDHGAACCPIGR